MQSLFPEASLQGRDCQAVLFRYLRNSGVVNAATWPFIFLLHQDFALINYRAEC